MSNLLIGLLGVLVATNQPAAVSNLVTQTTGITVSIPDSNDPIEQEYQKLLEEDDAAQEEADKWIRESMALETQGTPLAKATLTGRIEQRFQPVRKAYEDFLRRHPKHTKARIAYGSFLNDIHEEDEAVKQWEKAREIDPSEPSAWNNLANHFGHRGPVLKAFEYYEKAVELRPNEPVYLQNLATTTYLFRVDAQEYYKINEQQVFDRALELYQKAIKLDPNNFPLASDYAQSFYGIKPSRPEQAIEAWNYALKIANDELEREGILIHLARVKLSAGSYDQARQHLESVTNLVYKELKGRVLRNLNAKEKKSQTGQSAGPAAKESQ